MINKRIPAIALVAFATTFAVGCNKKEETPKEEVQQTVKEEKVKIINIEKASFKDLTELRNFSKTATSDFGKFLSSNKIDNVVSQDGSIAINKNMTYEKYTKEFNQLAYTHISTNFENGTGYLKTGLKLNFHMEETLNVDNTFAKAIFKIISKYNPGITEEAFNEELKSATSDPTNTSDYQFDLNIEGITLNIYSKPDMNEKELTLSIRQELEFPKTEELIKEYKTVKEFKDDSVKLSEDLAKKIEALNETLKNAYVGKSKEIEVKLKSIESNESSSFSQSVELEYNAKEIESIPDELLNGLYETIESLISKEKLSKIISSDDLKSYLKSLEVYSGLHTIGTLIDETGEAIQPNSLPFFDGIVELSVGFTPSEKKDSEENTEDKNNSKIKKYDNFIKLKIVVPVKAEGITSL